MWEGWDGGKGDDCKGTVEISCSRSHLALVRAGANDTREDLIRSTELIPRNWIFGYLDLEGMTPFFGI